MYPVHMAMSSSLGTANRAEGEKSMTDKPKQDHKVVAKCRKCGHTCAIDILVTKERAEEIKANMEKPGNIHLCPNCGEIGSLTYTVAEMEPEGEDLCDIALRASINVLTEHCKATGCTRMDARIGRSTMVVEYPTAVVEVVARSTTLQSPQKMAVLMDMPWLDAFATNYVCESLGMCSVEVKPEEQRIAIENVKKSVAEQIINRWAV